MRQRFRLYSKSSKLTFIEVSGEHSTAMSRSKTLADCLIRRFFFAPKRFSDELLLIVLGMNGQPVENLFILLLIFDSCFLQIYLSQYGYLSPKARNPTSGGNLLAQESWETAIREFQGFAGLNITGKLEKTTALNLFHKKIVRR